MSGSDKKLKNRKISDLHKKAINHAPIPFIDRHIMKAIEPVFEPTLNKFLFKLNNFHKESRLVKIEHDKNGIKEYTYERKKFFKKDEDGKWKCLICNSDVINTPYRFRNLDFSKHRIRHNLSGGKTFVFCNIDRTITQKEKVKHIGRYKPEDNGFLMVEDGKL